MMYPQEIFYTYYNKFGENYITRATKSRRMRDGRGHVEHKRDVRNAYRLLAGNHKGKKLL
jgi:hypothetical protein